MTGTLTTSISFSLSLSRSTSLRSARYVFDFKLNFKLTIITDFSLSVVTFDCVPWVVTMKKNEHYFPTVEWIKDPSHPVGWRRVTYEGGKVYPGECADGVNPVPEEMGNGEEPEVGSLTRTKAEGKKK